MIHKDEILKLVEELSFSDEIKLSDIPDLHLYIGQVQNFLTDKLSHLKRSKKDKILTTTMINNYTKDNLLMKPTKSKQYTKEHIILMILLYYLKQILSLDDIKRIFKVVLKDMSTTEDDVIALEDIYSIFIDLKNDEFRGINDTLSRNLDAILEKTKNINSQNPQEKEKDQEMAELFLVVIMLVAQAHAQKRLAEKIIDTYFKEDE
ncbi:DUF1836 domain-containing protein [Inediibacterium massiliense]|uniref:DUF1836 domain-containing protein n=1 Tax=Inediibacterium massiliense TaxID=1658111 RepID=UPI0006B587D9|nr:DUF1836 domain-containing protein [Inediibacterium massiliense]